MTATWWELDVGHCSARLTITGRIGDDADGLVDRLAGLDVAQIDLYVDSPGGNAASGLLIFHALLNHPVRVVAQIGRRANSAAGLIAVAADHRRIHWAGDMALHEARPLDDSDQGPSTEDLNALVAGVLALRTGHQDDGSAEAWRWRVGEFRRMMRADTTLVASQAVGWGLAHEVGGTWCGPLVDEVDLDDETVGDLAEVIRSTVEGAVAEAMEALR
jgi:ATP-dependent protease ClpP protease subunit